MAPPPRSSPRRAYRWAAPLRRAAPVFAAFVVAAGVLGALAEPFVPPGYAAPAA